MSPVEIVRAIATQVVSARPTATWRAHWAGRHECASRCRRRGSAAHGCHTTKLRPAADRVHSAPKAMGPGGADEPLAV
jgi:hypothetical protein